MKLLLDLGNTRLKWQLHEDECNEITGAWIHTEVLEHALIWKDLPLQGVWLAAVGQAALAEALGAQLQSYGHTVHVLTSPARQAGVINAYAEPAKLGIDRWLVLLAARHYVQGDVVVVDAGTAMTIDVLDKQGQHQGGLILPGLEMMRGSLHAKTQLLPRVEGESWLLGKSTEQAIAGGTLGALVSTVESVFKQQAPRGVQCLITGGDAELVYNALHSDVRQHSMIDPDCLFKGLLLASNA